VHAGVDPKAKEREDDEEAHRAAEREARRGGAWGNCSAPTSRRCVPRGR
jgi:hypothetical protein